MITIYATEIRRSVVGARDAGALKWANAAGLISHFESEELTCRLLVCSMESLAIAKLLKTAYRLLPMEDEFFGVAQL